MDAETSAMMRSNDRLAAQLAGALGINEVRRGFRSVPWPVKQRKPANRSSLRAVRGTKAKRPRKPALQYEVRLVLADNTGRLYGDTDVYELPLADGQKFRWATPEERVAVGDRLVQALLDHICPPERDRALGL